MDLCQAPKAVCPTIWIEWLRDICLSSMRLPLLEAVEGAATQYTPSMCHGPSPQGTYAAINILCWIAAVPTSTVDPPLVNMLATL